MTGLIKTPNNIFESIKHLDRQTGDEFWSARELMGALGYDRWENFSKIIKKTTQDFDGSLYDMNKHVRKVTKSFESGNNTVRLMDDYQLSRYACYLIAMNSDTKKPAVVAAKNYFAVQTRKQEVAELEAAAQRRLDARRKYAYSDRRLSGEILKRNVDRQGLARIKSDGDEVLFGGKNTLAMKRQYGLKKTDVLPDYLSPVVLAAKQLANEITTVNTKVKDLQGFTPIDSEHKVSNARVRKTLTDSGIHPEALPPEENVKKLERKMKKQRKLRS